jgi:hypothetical protein
MGILTLKGGGGGINFAIIFKYMDFLCLHYSYVSEHYNSSRSQSVLFFYNSINKYSRFYIYICIYVYGAPSKAKNLTYIYARDFVLRNLLFEPCISLIYAWITNKYTNYSFSVLIMYGSSYVFCNYIVFFRKCLLRYAQLRSSRLNIVDGRVVSSDVVCKHHVTRHNFLMECPQKEPNSPRSVFGE